MATGRAPLATAIRDLVGEWVLLWRAPVHTPVASSGVLECPFRAALFRFAAATSHPLEQGRCVAPGCRGMEPAKYTGLLSHGPFGAKACDQSRAPVIADAHVETPHRAELRRSACPHWCIAPPAIRGAHRNGWADAMCSQTGREDGGRPTDRKAIDVVLLPRDGYARQKRPSRRQAGERSQSTMGSYRERLWAHTSNSGSECPGWPSSAARRVYAARVVAEIL
jgi:hypothetical protein